VDAISWVVEPPAGERLDRAVAARLDLPRNQVQRWIRDGLVQVNGRESKPSAVLAAGDSVTCRPPERRDDRVQAEEGNLTVLHEDADIVVLDKPAGLTVHPGAGRATGTLAHHLLARYPEMAGVGGPGRPGIVHRLDQGTSGVLVVARTPAAHVRLARSFADRRVEKRYLAIVYGAPEPAAGMVDAPVGRHPQRRTEMAVRPGGRPARTLYRTLASAANVGNAAGISLLELDLHTGRTHQIRVHMKHLGHPLVGDPVYGEARWKALPRPLQAPLRDFPRPALHAWRLAFRHPTDDRPLLFEAAVPEDLKMLWERVTGGAFPPPPATGFRPEEDRRPRVKTLG
jgi:23S rRNA pseudouridine1911/1915/1917 synthase